MNFVKDFPQYIKMPKTALRGPLRSDGAICCRGFCSVSQAYVIVLLLVLTMGAAGIQGDESATEEKNRADGTHRLMAGGRERTFIIDVPESGGKGAPLVLVFHGTSGSARQARRDFGFTALVEKYGFVVAYPDATRETNPDGVRQFHVGYEFQQSSDVDDVGFVRVLIDHLARDPGIDPGAVFATGMSNGGDMSYLLATQPQPMVRATAPIAGTMMSSWGLDTMSFQPIPVMAVHSRDDGITLWEGDPQNRDGWGAYPGVETVMELWVGGLGLKPSTQDGQPEASRLREGLSLMRWQRSLDNTELRLYRFENIGHTWPDYLGDAGVSTAEEIMRFFQSHR
jgi:polyhydroxybutyrate depolymerase